ncbi:hypothetical protein ZWY2020_030323 [Hordeum vulgare]|nr:hypothetical protein ZWY2020_030323 [Hordeum vulgare]
MVHEAASVEQIVASSAARMHPTLETQLLKKEFMAQRWSWTGGGPAPPLEDSLDALGPAAQQPADASTPWKKRAPLERRHGRGGEKKRPATATRRKEKEGRRGPGASSTCRLSKSVVGWCAVPSHANGAAPGGGVDGDCPATPARTR